MGGCHRLSVAWTYRTLTWRYGSDLLLDFHRVSELLGRFLRCHSNV